MIFFLNTWYFSFKGIQRSENNFCSIIPLWSMKIIWSSHRWQYSDRKVLSQLFNNDVVTYIDTQREKPRTTFSNMDMIRTIFQEEGEVWFKQVTIPVYIYHRIQKNISYFVILFQKIEFKVTGYSNTFCLVSYTPRATACGSYPPVTLSS